MLAPVDYHGGAENSGLTLQARMPAMHTLVRALLSLVTITLLVGGPWAYAVYRERMSRNFHVVEDGVLYRSGQLPLEGLKRVIHDYGIQTVVCLRDGDKLDDKLERKYCNREGINHVRILQRKWSPTKGQVPAEIGLAEFRQVMDDPTNYPVLIHCFAGIHRTGAYCAVYRMDYQGWTNSQAIAEMKELGYETFDDDLDVRAYLENYSPVDKQTIRPASRTQRSPEMK